MIQIILLIVQECKYKNKCIFLLIFDKIIIFISIFSGGIMHFIGIITDKNSENNIKNIMKENLEEEMIFLNEKNLDNFKNIKFDSIVINNNIKNNIILDKILSKSKYILYNSDIDLKSDSFKKVNSNVITYGYNSNATVTISSATDESYLIFIQKNIYGYNEIAGVQEIKFERAKNNINAYDGMITTIINLIYSS